MVIRIDSRRLTDTASLYGALDEVFGFPAESGKNLDALIDLLTHLDNTQVRTSRVQVLPGQLVLLVLEHLEGHNKRTEAQIASLLDVIAFVNWRRLEKSQPPLLAVAYERE